MRGWPACDATRCQHILKQAVLVARGHYGHILVILCRRTYQRYAAYVYLLYYLRMVVGRCHRGLERIEVDDHKVYLGYLVLPELVEVAGVVTTGKYAAEHLGMKRLDTPAQYGGITRERLHRASLVSHLLYEREGTPGRIYLNAGSSKHVDNLTQCAFYLFHRKIITFS